MKNHQPIVTAKKLLQYKKDYGHIGDCKIPKTVLVCYQRSTLLFLLKEHPEFHPSEAVSHFYVDGGQVGILGDWGVGAPGLSIKIEELIALGANQFIAVGTAAGLMNAHDIADFVFCPKALAEDGVAHLYLPEGKRSAEADPQLLSEWNEFAKNRSLPPFRPAFAWSFSALFRETVADVLRVHKEGYTVVEMEAATLYAIGLEKGVQTLSLFTISDSITQEAWTPRLREIRAPLHRLADWALEFCGADIPSKESAMPLKASSISD